MSNPLASMLLNNVLHLLEDYKFFETQGKEKTLTFIKKICEIGDEYDCNKSEIVEGIGEKLGICYGCIKFYDSLKEGLCLKCEKIEKILEDDQKEELRMQLLVATRMLEKGYELSAVAEISGLSEKKIALLSR